jgi:hypothetical protein
MNSRQRCMFNHRMIYIVFKILTKRSDDNRLQHRMDGVAVETIKFFGGWPTLSRVVCIGLHRPYNPCMTVVILRLAHTLGWATNDQPAQWQ